MIDITLEKANEYFLKRLHATEWTNASVEERTNGLIMANYILDAAFTWTENAYMVDEQENGTWHPRIVAAVCEQALTLLRQDSVREALLPKGLSVVTLPGCSVSFSKENCPSVCTMAILMIGNLGIPVEPNRQFGEVSASMLEY